MNPIEANHPTILFDGICNLCNSAVQFVIKNDSKKYFKLGSLQNKPAKLLVKKYGYEDESLSSFVLIENNKLYTKSSAALKVVYRLNGLWKIFYIFILIPKFLRDLVYEFVAKNRYRWFGKKDQCWIPNENLKDRFID